MKVFAAGSLFLCMFFAGCAGVKLYKDEALKTQTGLKFYYPHPYLLVEQNVSKDTPVKTSLIFLPDLANPVYAKVKSGLGSSNFSLELANGALSTYGLVTDSQIPETLTAAAGLLTGVASILTKSTDTVNSVAAKQDKKEAAPFQLYEIVATEKGPAYKLVKPAAQ